MDIPKVDLRGVEPGVPGRWEEARAAVTASMVAHGCVVVACDALEPALREVMFGLALPELFELPPETKQRNVSARWFRSYMARAETDYESVCVNEPTDNGNIHEFTNLFWPQGNPEFSGIMLRFANNLLQLDQTLQRMTLEGLGVREDTIRSHLRSLTHSLRASRFGVQQDTGSRRLSMAVHRDFNMSTLVVQHEVEGLEVLAKDGSWLPTRAEPDTFTFQAGELFTILTNGRVPASVHRVRTLSNRERFSLVFGSWSADGDEVSAMDDLVDGEHPLMYNPCRLDEYVDFLFIKEGRKLVHPLKAFCGVHKGTSME
ncbi:hypothetical protein BDA96_03G166600 [Sorghum bicolor]|uniref:2-oxoglutarate-dependent dioxygenase DAO n=1 Tax=Sorghum bicolor TaxID=4558 RepID=A0A921RCX5_SORBI|nr:hypothetical protein BDA96_03G166600 [Sorghum bicolor]